MASWLPTIGRYAHRYREGRDRTDDRHASHERILSPSPCHLATSPSFYSYFHNTRHETINAMVYTGLYVMCTALNCNGIYIGLVILSYLRSRRHRCSLCFSCRSLHGNRRSIWGSRVTCRPNNVQPMWQDNVYIGCEGRDPSR